MRRINEYPGDLTKPYDELIDELQNRTEVITGGSHHWALFQHPRYSKEVWLLWCNEGYGLRLKEHELNAIKRLITQADKLSATDKSPDYGRDA